MADPMKGGWKGNIVAAVVSIGVVAPLLWMIMDRTPPYDREWGEIIEAPAGSCGDEVTPSGIVPGGCANIKWALRVNKNCAPSTEYNVTRSFIDSEGVPWTITPVGGVFGTTAMPTSTLSRFIRIPSAIAKGRTVYRSTATYACYPWQYYVWPIVINRPDLVFYIK